MKDKFVAFIPARANSQRMANKVTRPFAGRSLLGWAIVQAVCSRHIEDVYVITDDEEATDQAKGEGVRILWQPTEQCQHGRIGGSVAIAWALKYVQNFDHFLVVMPTAPLRKPDDLDKAIEMYVDLKLISLSSRGPIDKLIPYYDIGDGCSFPASPYRLFDFLSYCEVVGITSREQYMNTHFPDGEIDISEVIRKGWEGLERETAPGPGIILPSYHYPVERWQVYDIDYIDEFVAAEAIFEECILLGDHKCYEHYKEAWIK